MKYLVTGLESSSTKIVSKMIAINLGLINDLDQWDGHEEIFNESDVVCHKSIPHGPEDIFIEPSFSSGFDYVVLSTRDWNCSLLSKIENHEHNPIKANEQHRQGIETIKQIMLSNKIHIFSSETAFLLQEFYTIPFLKSIGIEHPKHIVFDNPNRKYLKDIGL